jgi:hypothetical protein
VCAGVGDGTSEKRRIFSEGSDLTIDFFLYSSIVLVPTVFWVKVFFVIVVVTVAVVVVVAAAGV